MGKNKNPIKRIEFLAKRFNVFDLEDIESLSENDNISDDGIHYVEVRDDGDEDNSIYALHSFNERKLANEGIKVPKNIRVADFVFMDIVRTDPTEHKEYVQWMLTTFTRFIKESDYTSALMFVKEDLWMATEYLKVFHKQKNKPIFKELCSRNRAFKDISDPSNINNYKSLSQLFDAVDPHIEKDVSKLEKDLRNMVTLKLGDIPYEDRKVMVFTPLSVKSSRLFGGLTNWCTTASKDSYNHYVNQKTPFKTKSKLYIVIFKTYFLEDTDPNKTHELYQLHFETYMFMDRKDRRIQNVGKLIEGNDGLSKFFYHILYKMAVKAGKEERKYVDILYGFGFTDILFDILPSDTSTIKYIDYNIGTTPNLSRLKNTVFFYLYNTGLTELHPSIGGLDKLSILSLPHNKLATLPKTIGKLNELKFLNLFGNELKELPEEIKMLDESNGGSLRFLSINNDLVDMAQALLPSVEINK